MSVRRKWMVVSLIVLALGILVALVFFSGRKLPTGIKHSTSLSRHIYRFSGLYGTDTLKRYGDKYAKSWASEHADGVAGCEEVRFDLSTSEATIITRRRIYDVEKVIDSLAGLGNFPYMEEYKARDNASAVQEPALFNLVVDQPIAFNGSLFVDRFESSEKGKLTVVCSSAKGSLSYPYPWQNFVVTCADGQIVVRAANEARDGPVPDFDKIRHPMEISPAHLAKSRTGTLRFNKSTAHCMAESRYAMRIYLNDGKWVWQDQDNIRAAFYPCLFDLDGDGLDEIVVFINDHDAVSVLVYQQTSAKSAR